MKNNRWGTLIVLFTIFSWQAHAGAYSIQTNVPALKDVFAHDFRIGCMLSCRHVGFPSDPFVFEYMKEKEFPRRKPAEESSGNILLKAKPNRILSISNEDREKRKKEGHR